MHAFLYYYALQFISVLMEHGCNALCLYRKKMVHALLYVVLNIVFEKVFIRLRAFAC